MSDQHPWSCQCCGDGEVERGPAGATYSYPCYPWDCNVPNCGCKAGTRYEEKETDWKAEAVRLREVILNERNPEHLGSLAYQLRQALNATAPHPKARR